MRRRGARSRTLARTPALSYPPTKSNTRNFFSFTASRVVEHSRKEADTAPTDHTVVTAAAVLVSAVSRVGFEAKKFLYEGMLFHCVSQLHTGCATLQLKESDTARTDHTFVTAAAVLVSAVSRVGFEAKKFLYEGMPFHCVSQLHTG